MTLTINNVEFSRIEEFSAKRECRRTDIRYNTQGDLLIDLVNRKYRLTVRFGLLTEKELKRLRDITENIFVTVSFPAPEGQVTAEFHVSDEPAPVVTTVNGVTMYSGVELTLLQK